MKHANKPHLKSKKIAVLMGGKSGEREISFRSGKRIFSSLEKQGFNVISLDPAEVDLIVRLKQEKVDIAYIALHGEFGEDGVVQGLLEHYEIPYTGSKVLASALAMNKVAAKKIWQVHGIPTPHYFRINKNDLEKDIAYIKERFSFPLMLKPISEGSSLGISLVKDSKSFEVTAKATIQKFEELFVEEYISGTEITIGILGIQPIKALPILELVPKKEFYDYEAKYTKGLTEFILPARLSEAVYQKAQEIALAAHRALGCYGVSRVDLIVSSDGIPYVHEINTVPGMTETSDLPAQARHQGISFDELVVRVLESAY